MRIVEPQYSALCYLSMYRVGGPCGLYPLILPWLSFRPPPGKSRARNGVAGINIQGEIYECKEAARQQFQANEALLMKGPGEWVV